MVAKNNDEEVFRYSERRRYDPEILARVEKVHNARNAVLLSSAKKLKEVRDDLRVLSVFEDCSIYNRCEEATWRAYGRVDSDADFMQGIGSECYMGNLAAGRLGYQVEQMGDEFYKYFPEGEV